MRNRIVMWTAVPQSRGQSPEYNSGDPYSVRGQSKMDLWRKHWQCNRIILHHGGFLLFIIFSINAPYFIIREVNIVHFRGRSSTDPGLTVPQNKTNGMTLWILGSFLLPPFLMIWGAVALREVVIFAF